MAGTLILGGGFGGLTVATELRRLLGDEHELVLVDRARDFSMGLRKLWELVGEASIREGTRSRERLREQRIGFLQGEVEAIDPVARSAVVGGERIVGDYLVLALGAEPRPDLVPGLAEYGHDVWSVRNVAAARDALEAFTGGRIAIVIAGVPYPCPPAPFECAFLVDEYLRRRGSRDRTEIEITTLQPLLLPNAGKEGSAWLAEQLERRGVAYQTGRKPERVEAGRVVFADGELEFDLLLAVPPHRPPAVVEASGLAEESGWIGVAPATLETEHTSVFALGDVIQIVLANRLLLPKAGVIAEREGVRVAAAIAADVRGAQGPPPFDGRGYCFLELGAAEAALVQGEFFAEPEPQVAVGDVSPAHAAEKRRFEAERLTRWFGR